MSSFISNNKRKEKITNETVISDLEKLGITVEEVTVDPLTEEILDLKIKEDTKDTEILTKYGYLRKN